MTSIADSFTFDDQNRLLSSTVNDYTYDADGNLIQEKNKLTTETRKYYCDSESRMIKYEHQSSDISPVDITAEYQYDIYGRRLQKAVNGVETNFFWDGDTMTLELNDQNKPIRRYITGTSVDDYEGHLEYSEVTDWGKIFDFNYPSGWYSYIKDQVGSIYRVYDHKNHTYINTRRFDVFGNMLNQTGTSKTNLGFQGKYLDTETGLYYFYHRYYSPSIGRFITEDPIGFSGSMNFYDFTQNNPINFIDPTGNLIVTDYNYFPGPINRKYSEYNVTIWDYIWWTLKGSWDDISSYNWCCFTDCMEKRVTKNVQLIFDTLLAFGFEIFQYWAVSIEPFLYPVTTQVSNVSQAIIIIQYGKEFIKCFKECR